MSNKAAETTRNITKAFGPGTANEQTVQWWFKKFCKRDESLEDEEHSSRPSEVDNHQLKAIIKADPLTTIQEAAKKLSVDHSIVVWHLKLTGKVKKLDKWMPRELSENQKNHHFEVSSSHILCNNSEPFLDQTPTCNEKWIVSDNQWQPAYGWMKKHFPKPNLQQNRSRSLFCGLLLIWFTTAFGILVKPLHLRSMLSKSMRCTKNCNTCSQHWLTERARFFSKTTSDRTLYNQCFKSWTNWATKFCLICHIHLTSGQPTTTSSRISTTFCREDASTNSRRQNMFSKSWSNPRAWIFMLQE